MQSELINQTLVAAEAARQKGYHGTYIAMMEIVRELAAERAAAISADEKLPS